MTTFDLTAVPVIPWCGLPSFGGLGDASPYLPLPRVPLEVWGLRVSRCVLIPGRAGGARAGFGGDCEQEVPGPHPGC